MIGRNFLSYKKQKMPFAACQTRADGIFALWIDADYCGPMYLSLPKPRISLKIGFKKNSPMVKPVPWPKALASLFRATMLMMVTASKMAEPRTEKIPSKDFSIPPITVPNNTNQ